MDENVKKKIEEKVDGLEYGEVIITLKRGRIVNIQVNQSFEIHEERK